jgi:hypothetical protein
MTSRQQSIAERGEEIYRERYQAELERTSRGSYVVIDVDRGDPYVGDTPEIAVQAALEAAPKGRFHLILVGAPAAFKVGCARCGGTSGDRQMEGT